MEVVSPVVLVCLRSLGIVFPSPISGTFFRIYLCSFGEEGFFGFFSSFLFFCERYSKRCASRFFEVFSLTICRQCYASYPVVYRGVSPSIRSLSPDYFCIAFPLVGVLHLF